MQMLPKPIAKVIESFERLPGIGPKTAQRLGFYLLHVPQEELDRFSDSVKQLKTQTILCEICKNVTESTPCVVCTDPARDIHVACVVEQPTDVLAIERTGKFKGVYHVLHGAIDPLNNIGPDEIYIADFVRRVQEGKIDEIILAMNPNMEGEATAMYITNAVRKVAPEIRITRLAHGLPVGADIEYADDVTLSRALEGRREY